MCDIINKSLDKLFPAESGVKVIGEPGRFFSASAYYLVTNITTKKTCAVEDIRDENNNINGCTTILTNNDKVTMDTCMELFCV